MKKEKVKEKEKKIIKYTIKVNGEKKKTTFFFPAINQSSKTYCQEQLKANSPHVQPG